MGLVFGMAKSSYLEGQKSVMNKRAISTYMLGRREGAGEGEISPGPQGPKVLITPYASKSEEAS